MAKKDNKPIVVKIWPQGCPRCGSTERTSYHHIEYQDHSGEMDGKIYTRIKRQRTECTSCGQSRVEMVYERCEIPCGGNI
jgi:predicted transcriptional regulator